MCKDSDLRAAIVARCVRAEAIRAVLPECLPLTRVIDARRRHLLCVKPYYKLNEYIARLLNCMAVGRS